MSCKSLFITFTCPPVPSGRLVAKLLCGDYGSLGESGPDLHQFQDGSASQHQTRVSLDTKTPP